MDTLEAEDIHAIEQLLRSHESVKDAAVLSVQKYGENMLVGFVTLHDQALENQIRTLGQSGDEFEAEQVQLWESVFDRRVYATIDDEARRETVGRDFTGWISAYDGSLLDKTDMNEWLDDTIDMMVTHGIRDGPVSIVELGTGSGMILFSLARHLHSYHGIEPSRRAVDFVSATAQSIPELADKVHVYEGTATDFHLLGSPSPDLVVINSVAQYFPSQAYLLEVVEGILKFGSVQTVVFGDIRSFALQKEFLVTKALHATGGKASKGALREKISELEQAEIEFMIDPAFFTSLPDRFPGIVEHVCIVPKKMKATNELSCYRYAAVLYIASKNQQNGEKQQQHLVNNIREVADDEWIDFVAHRLDRATLSHRLTTKSPDIMAVSNIPYSKTAFERHCLDALVDGKGQEENADDDSAWLASVRQSSQESPSLSALDLANIAQEADYQVETSWARQFSQRGGFDAIFYREQQTSDTVAGSGRRGGKALWRFPTDHSDREPSAFSNQPLQQQARQTIQRQLFETLEDQLPMESVPEDIVILSALPSTEDGKVDRQALSEKTN
ncbi:Nonribosomal peptide synthetase TES [Colletotrichum siamense]|uniref:Nonribosomal peptide synthetase TES n=1 Tax=Colletotrichum siamense TaxID=690259 RepID=A0A9P5ETA8_COLSI|nr:Nonribosomal peptide synthetase TES [Colletotrichum siamense]KAF4859044.1 Nonribosomal peptide synthetase TES [Colletotrichum siamense]